MIESTLRLRAALAVCIVAGAGCQTLTSETTLGVMMVLVETAQTNYPERYGERTHVLMNLFQCASREALRAKYGREYDLSDDKCPPTLGTPPIVALDSDSHVASRGTPLDLDIAILKRLDPTSDAVVEIADNDVLYDGLGEDESADQFRIFIKPNVDTYLHVVSIDSTGWIQPLLPSRFPDAVNPVRAGNTYVLPDEAHWYGLDEFEGIEHVIFVASPHPRPDFSDVLATIAAEEQPAPRGTRTVRSAYVVEEEVLRRGLTGIRPGAVSVMRPSAEDAYEVRPTNYSAATAGTALVVTRFFQHR